MPESDLCPSLSVTMKSGWLKRINYSTSCDTTILAMRRGMTKTMNRDLLLASTNQGKIRELTQMLLDVPVHLLSLTDFPSFPVPDEPGETFEANAAIKATTYGRLSGVLTLADDSGLEVAALGGAPGVHSARYGGEGATDAEKMIRLLEEIKTLGTNDRRARFVCVVALFDPMTERQEIFTGMCAGRLATEPCGSLGFGYDPIFIPDNYQESFAQLPTNIKQRISHRAQALNSTRQYLLRHFETIDLPDIAR